MRKLAIIAATLLFSAFAHAQSVKQSGNVTPQHIPVWVTSGVIGDGGTSADSPISSIGVTNNGGNGVCVNSGRITSAGWNSLCLGAQTNGPAFISLQNYGTAPAESIEFLINGTIFTPAVLPLATTQQLYGGSGAAGIASVISLGTNLSITGGVLNASGGGSGTPCTIIPLSLQYNNAGSLGCTTGITYGGSGQLNIGNPGTTLGTAVFGNTVSGTITLEATTGVALGSNVLQLPVATGTLATLPNAATNQLFGGSGAAGSANIVSVGSGLTLSGGTLTASGGSGGTGTAQRATFCATSILVTPPCQATGFTPGTTTSITLPFTPTSATAVWIWDDAGYQDGYTYTVIGTTVTFANPIPSNVSVVEVTAGTAAGGFSPGGSNTDVQYQSGGVFAGTSSFTTNGNGQITLGTAGSTTGSIVLSNTTSGTLTVQPPSSGALGSNTLTLPITTSTLAALGLAQTWTAAQTYSNDDLQILGTSTGVTTLASANGTSTNYTITFPAVNGQVLTTGNTVTVPQGGTGVTTLTAYAPLFGGTTTTGPIQSGALGTAGQVLTSNGTGALPTFQSPSSGGNGSRYTNAVTTCGADPTGTTDSSSAITTCLASASTSALAFPQGTYLACNVQIVNQQTSIVGVGVPLSDTLPAGSSPGGTVFKCNSSTQSVFVVATSGSTTLFMQGFSCTKSTGVTPSSGSCVTSSGSAICSNCIFRDLFAENQYNGFAPPPGNGWFDNVIAFNNYHDGFYLAVTSSSTGNNISYSGVGMLSLLNSAYGYELFASNGIFNTVGQWASSLSFANGLGGVFVHVTGGGTTINDLYLSGWTSSSDNDDCLQFNNGGNFTLSGGLVEGCGVGVGGTGNVGRNQSISPSHTGNGVNAATSVTGVIISGMDIATSASNGLGTASSTTGPINISGSYFYFNGEIANTCGTNCNGITLGGTSVTAAISGNTFFSGPNMAYSFFSNTASTVTATGNVFVSGTSGSACGGSAFTKAGNIGSGC